MIRQRAVHAAVLTFSKEHANESRQVFFSDSLSLSLSLSLASLTNVAHAQPWGSNEAKIVSIFQKAIGLDEPLFVLVHSSLSEQEITYNHCLVRKAGAMSPVDTLEAPAEKFPNNNHEFQFDPPPGDWETSVLYLIEWEVHTSTHWYKTIVVISFDSSAGITVWDYYSQSGEIA